MELYTEPTEMETRKIKVIKQNAVNENYNNTHTHTQSNVGNY